MRMLPSGYSPGSREPAMTPPRARQNCLHAQRRPRRAHGDNLHPCRRKSVATAAFRRSPARLNHRHVPGNHSVARTLAPQRHAPASQRHAGVQLRPRGGHLGPPSQPARQRRPCRSSWAGAQPARPTVVGALLTPCDQGRHDGCPHRLGGRQEGRVTLKLGSPRVRVAARRGCAVWRDHDDESAHHSTVCDTGALHRRDVGRPVPLRLPQRRGVAGERG